MWLPGSGTVFDYFTRDPQGTLISMRQGSCGTSTNSYYLLDQQGSVIKMTATDGTAGTLFATNPFWFAGAYYDTNSEEYKLGARYLGGTGFTQVDPPAKTPPTPTPTPATTPSTTPM